MYSAEPGSVETSSAQPESGVTSLAEPRGRLTRDRQRHPLQSHEAQRRALWGREVGRQPLLGSLQGRGEPSPPKKIPDRSCSRMASSLLNCCFYFMNKQFWAFTSSSIFVAAIVVSSVLSGNSDASASSLFTSETQTSIHNTEPRGLNMIY